ncbi:MAG: hypothetical protein MZV64_11250 [Ignavibacteriales bacterium]|nr:hypothetical protein [Ignavibacteriales bacterium]
MSWRVRCQEGNPTAQKGPEPKHVSNRSRSARRGSAGSTRSPRGGLPRGRPTLVCGEAGCGKTLLAMEFIVRGASASSASPACS